MIDFTNHHTVKTKLNRHIGKPHRKMRTCLLACNTTFRFRGYYKAILNAHHRLLSDGMAVTKMTAIRGKLQFNMDSNHSMILEDFTIFDRGEGFSLWAEHSAYWSGMESNSGHCEWEFSVLPWDYVVACFMVAAEWFQLSINNLALHLNRTQFHFWKGKYIPRRIFAWFSLVS
jgi:hypothetical protein